MSLWPSPHLVDSLPLSPGCRGLTVVTDKTLCPLLSRIAAHQRPTLTKAASFNCQRKRDSPFNSCIKLAAPRRLGVRLWLSKESEVVKQGQPFQTALPGPSQGHKARLSGG